MMLEVELMSAALLSQIRKSLKVSVVVFVDGLGRRHPNLARSLPEVCLYLRMLWR